MGTAVGTAGKRGGGGELCPTQVLSRAQDTMSQLRPLAGDAIFDHPEESSILLEEPPKSHTNEQPEQERNILLYIAAGSCLYKVLTASLKAFNDQLFAGAGSCKEGHVTIRRKNVGDYSHRRVSCDK